MAFFCQGLELPAIPHIGIYDTEGYVIFQAKEVACEIRDMPEDLERQLSTLNLDPRVFEFKTLYHDARYLSYIENTVEVNLLFQPYVFYDSQYGQKHECTVKMAVYQHGNPFMFAHLNYYTNDSVAFNPKEIGKCNFFTCIHPEGDSMCLSPNNGRVKVSAYVPMHIFYTILLVPYQGKIAKVLTCKHILSINPDLIRNLTFPDSILNEPFSISLFTHLLQLLGDHEGWVWYFHNVAWRKAGCPKGHNFGKHHWEQLITNFQTENDDASFQALNDILSIYLEDLCNWLALCKSSISLIP